jgi:mono/diheme cytochrome c family protein
MKKLIILLIGLSAIFTNLFAQSLGKDVFLAKCASCHSIAKPDDISSMIAPPIKGVMYHLNEEYSYDKELIQEHIVDLVLNPTKEKAICKSVKRFGLMPSQKGNITNKELDIVAKWMTDELKAGYGKGHNKH